MTSTVGQSQITSFLAQTPPFDSLDAKDLQALASKCQMLRYRTGQPIFELGKMPTQVVIIYEGKARELAGNPTEQIPISLRVAEPGEIFGWVSHLRKAPSETLLSSSEVICITIPAADFLDYLKAHPTIETAFKNRVALVEVYELLKQELERRAHAAAATEAAKLANQLWSEAIVLNVTKGADLQKLDPRSIWFLSQGKIDELTAGSLVLLDRLDAKPKIGSGETRLIGLNVTPLNRALQPPPAADEPQDSLGQAAPEDAIPYAPPVVPEVEFDPLAPRPKYPFVAGRGEINAPLACFLMLARHLGMKNRKDSLRRVLKDQLVTNKRLTLQSCGAVGAMMGLNGQLVTVPVELIPRLKAPAIIRWRNSFALLYEISTKEIVMGIPEQGIVRKNPKTLSSSGSNPKAKAKCCSCNQKPMSPKKFSFWWFWPELKKYKLTLFQVFLASFFVQLFGLANPLITQVIIDKVLVQRSIDTLHVLGVFMVAVAAFEALLTGLRTYLFVDATNRIDLSLGSQVIDHLLRLPLNYFDHRRVGETAGRVHELERIRQFLTGTALTVVLDAVFSMIYIAVMLSYSLIMTLVALATLPFFVLLIFLVSPIVRRLLRNRAERYADVQSYLVEVVSGIQTVKAQTIELKSRWSWYERYARYVSAGFQTVLTSTAASSFSGFLNKLSGLLLLWVGAYMVLEGEMTLGQLIAFRIIAANVTGSLLRFVQVWQTFQETAMSVERIRDILDAKPEADEENRSNIPLPEIKGGVEFQDISFRFTNSGPLQLANINLKFEPGQFVGLVGQSGSGKSTLMKLLQRLYDPNSGTIAIDGYDISKVELYSLRRQIGVVLQDTLLFNGSVQENISLTNPEATTEEIIEAAQIAVAHDFIMSLSNGYNTVVGERGSSLSGGQRQRLAIARTVLQNPHLLILDEATSALDYKSERQVCDNLRHHFRGRTVFFITHRLQTVQQADVILMMDKGIVVEQGTHDELMALKGAYYSLYQQQEAQM
ncbi:type I secretion system permease/ATPase [[Phormidium] sp. ETS-05]|uniref:type I secretion system permease/ATPase n=1 Tax=[Phormidium] sp. ETS-05 TaxID=222819 RepID=UPI0018EED684|nr:peptidase domain-containing ABC transporter [[Phormidium] sp. ETS-05]